MTVTIETFTGSNGSTAASPWVLVTLSGTQNIQSNKWHIVNGASFAGTAMTYGSANYADVDITVTITLDAAGAEQYPGIAARMSGGTNGWAAFAEASSGYMAWFNAIGDTVNIGREDSGTVSILASTAMTLAANTAYKLRFQCVGRTVRCKGWAAASGEPGPWTLSATDTTYTSGLIGFRDQAATGTITSDWDDFTFDDAPPALPLTPTLVQAIGTQVTNAAALTTVISFTTAIKPAVGDLVVVYGSRDNGTNDVANATTDTFTDSQSNTWNLVALAQPAGTSTALAGIVGVFFWSKITTAWAAGTNTLTWNHPSMKAAMQMEHWTNVTGLRGSNTAGSAAGAASCALTSPINGDLVLGMEAIEYSTAGTSTGDADTTNGSWAAVSGPTATTGTTLAAVKVISQYKVVTADGTQTYNPTHSVTTNVDCVAIVAAFTPVTPPNQSRYLSRGLAVQRAATR